MLNGLDLFSGIGGLAKALEDWVTPIAYCENDRYAQGVLLSRMAGGELPVAPIWDDVRTLLGSFLKPIDIIYGGFPCQDISVAGNGKGLAGERSGLFFEIMRLAKETKPTFIFLENVPAIRTRGLSTVLHELAEAGYDCRYGFLSAYDVGAPHLRERWFLLAKRKRHVANTDSSRQIFRESETSEQVWNETRRKKFERLGCYVADTESLGCREESENVSWDSKGSGTERLAAGFDLSSQTMDNSSCGRFGTSKETIRPGGNSTFDASWWAIEPDVGRVANGIPNRVDRIKCLGNAVVPTQAKEAFERLMGLK